MVRIEQPSDGPRRKQCSRLSCLLAWLVIVWVFLTALPLTVSTAFARVQTLLLPCLPLHWAALSAVHRTALASPCQPLGQVDCITRLLAPVSGQTVHHRGTAVVIIASRVSASAPLGALAGYSKAPRVLQGNVRYLMYATGRSRWRGVPRWRSVVGGAWVLEAR